MVVRHRGQVRVDELDAAAVENHPVGGDRYQHGPAGMVRHADDRAVRHHLTHWAKCRSIREVSFAYPVRIDRDDRTFVSHVPRRRCRVSVMVQQFLQRRLT